MSKQIINLGSGIGTHDGDGARTGGRKINENFTEVYDAIDLLISDSSIYNKIIKTTGFSLTGQNLTINANWEWILSNVGKTNPANVVIDIPFCSTGKSRIEYIVPNDSNGFTRISGVESETTPVAPLIPNKDMYVTFFIVSDGAIGVPASPTIGDTFVDRFSPQRIKGLKTFEDTVRFRGDATDSYTDIKDDKFTFYKNRSDEDGGGSVSITAKSDVVGEFSQELQAKDGIVALVGDSYLKEESDDLLGTKLDASAYNQHFKGVYLTEAALNAAHPAGSVGDYAQVNEVGATDVVNYSWDAEESIWVNNGTGGSGAVNTDALPEGSTNLYWTVARFLANLTYANVIAALGFTPSTAPNDAQKNSDITKAEIEAKLTGEITTHTHQVIDTISYALSDTSTALATGDTDPFQAPYNFTLVSYWIGVKTAPTVSSLIVDVKKNGTSITSTKAGIDATEKTSLTGTSPVLTTTSFTKGDEITPNIYQVGSSETGRSLKLYLEIIKT